MRGGESSRPGLFHGQGPRARRLTSHLARRAQAARARRAELDRSAFSALFRRRAVVFTDTADFTVRAARDGILHFLMIFGRVVAAVRPLVARAGGAIVKVEADSLLLGFDHPDAACRAVEAIEAFLRRDGRRRPKSERLRFSYGIGYGDVLDVEGDLFGLEVNLASKLGEDRARPGQALLTPSASAALGPATLGRVVPHGIVRFGGSTLAVRRLRLRRNRPR